MKKETVDQLLAGIMGAYKRSWDNSLKIRALELAIKKYEPNMYQAYMDILGELQKHATDPPNLAFEDLHARLLQE